VLLRGINLGPNRRVAMPALRELLSGAGFSDVSTYVQSGNVVLGTELGPDQLETECEELIAEHFGFEVDVLARTAEQLAQIVAADPLGNVAADPKRYQVSFLSAPLAGDRLRELEVLAQGGERLVAIGRELYGWHPEGVARSRLSAKLAGAGLGVKATARNWNTVRALLERASS
jgi:uncharacterized protein (DUF1697 family)